jgi:hypothetical protein
MAVAPTSSAQSPSKALRRTRRNQVFDVTKRRHARFNLMEKHWRFLLESYNGGPEYLYKGIAAHSSTGVRQGLSEINRTNLFKNLKEGNGEYLERMLRSHRKNYSKKVVDQIRSFIARKPPMRKTEDADTALAEYWKNADGRGRDIDRFMALATQWLAAMGVIWILVDKPMNEFDSFDDELDSGLPFARIFFPFDVLDSGFDSLGHLKWVLVREVRREDDDPMAESPVEEHFVLWDRQTWRVFRQNPNSEEAKTKPFIEVESGEHGLGVVPFRRVMFSESDDPFVAGGLLDDIAYLDRSVFNKQSQLDTIIVDQTFSQLVMPTDGVILNSPNRSETGADAIEASRELTRSRLQEMGTKRMFLFNGLSQHPPRYISPDGISLEGIQKEIDKEIKEIYRLAGLLGEVGREVKTQTGVSKAYDFDRLNKVLSFVAQELELADKWIAKIVMRWMALDTPRELPVDLVQYPENFDIMGLLELLDIAVRSDEYGLDSPTADTELRRMVTVKLLPGLTEETLRTILAEQEKAKDQRIKMAERLPLDPAAVPPNEDPRAPRPSERRGAGGGARQPGAGPPTRPTIQQANSAEAGQGES